MNKKFETAININEIRSIFKEYCKENKMEFSEKRFIEFLKFLEIDFYDWIKENFKHFHNQKQK